MVRSRIIGTLGTVKLRITGNDNTSVRNETMHRWTFTLFYSPSKPHPKYTCTVMHEYVLYISFPSMSNPVAKKNSPKWEEEEALWGTRLKSERLMRYYNSSEKNRARNLSPTVDTESPQSLQLVILLTRCFSSAQRCSMRFKLCDWDDHDKTTFCGHES